MNTGNTEMNARYWLYRWIEAYPDQPEEIFNTYQEMYWGQRPRYFSYLTNIDLKASWNRNQWVEAIYDRCNEPVMFTLIGKDLFANADQPCHTALFQNYRQCKERILDLFGKAPFQFKLTLTEWEHALKAQVVTDRQAFSKDYREVEPFGFEAFCKMYEPVPFGSDTLKEYIYFHCKHGHEPKQFLGRKNLGI